MDVSYNFDVICLQNGETSKQKIKICRITLFVRVFFLFCVFHDKFSPPLVFRKKKVIYFLTLQYVIARSVFSLLV